MSFVRRNFWPLVALAQIPIALWAGVGRYWFALYYALLIAGFVVIEEKARRIGDGMRPLDVEGFGVIEVPTHMTDDEVAAALWVVSRKIEEQS